MQASGELAINEGVRAKRNNNPGPAPPRETKLTVSFGISHQVFIVFAGINMFWARLRLILARAARRRLK